MFIFNWVRILHINMNFQRKVIALRIFFKRFFLKYLPRHHNYHQRKKKKFFHVTQAKPPIRHS